MNPKQKINFLKKFVPTDAVQCWPWIGAHSKRGYGEVSLNYKTVWAHRAMWEHVCSAIPKQLDVLHHCDNKSCVNPAHLYLGTDADNARDRVDRGRSSSKLSKDDVIAIRANAESHSKLAERYGVCVANINGIKQGRYWKHIKSKLNHTTRSLIARYSLAMRGI